MYPLSINAYDEFVNAFLNARIASTSPPTLFTTSAFSGDANKTQSFLLSQILSIMYFATPEAAVPLCALPCRIKLTSTSSGDLYKS